MDWKNNTYVNQLAQTEDLRTSRVGLSLQLVDTNTNVALTKKGTKFDHPSITIVIVMVLRSSASTRNMILSLLVFLSLNAAQTTALTPGSINTNQSKSHPRRRWLANGLTTVV